MADRAALAGLFFERLIRVLVEIVNHSARRFLGRFEIRLLTPIRLSSTAMQQPAKFKEKAPCAGALDSQDEHPFVRCTRDAPAGNSMIGVVLVTHGRLAIEFRAALEHVVGPQGQIEAVTIGPDDDVEERRRDIIEAVKRVDTGDGVAILTDMFGGTPSNLAISVMSRPKVEVLAGINLPMLVKLAKVRDECPLADAVAAAQEAGRKYVTIASRVLTGK
jgi:PTS system mannose-specific IIA component